MSGDTKFRILTTKALILHIGITSFIVRIMFRMHIGKAVPAEEWDRLTKSIDEVLEISKELLSTVQEPSDGD